MPIKKNFKFVNDDALNYIDENQFYIEKYLNMFFQSDSDNESNRTEYSNASKKLFI